MIIERFGTLFDQMGLTVNFHAEMFYIIWSEFSSDEKIKRKNNGVMLSIEDLTPKRIALIHYVNQAFPMMTEKYKLMRRYNLQYMWSLLSNDEIDKWIEKINGPFAQFEKYKVFLSYLQNNCIPCIDDVQAYIMKMLLELNNPIPPIIYEKF